MTAAARIPGREAIAVRGWLPAHKWLLLRRVSQAAVLGIFLVGPLTGWWLVKGTLASSLTLDILPLTDPLILLQSLIAGHGVAMSAVIGAAIVLAAYLVVGGRVYCSWVCPVNPVTDAAAWARGKLGLTGGITPSRRIRHWLLAAILVVAAATGTLAWELVNPVTITFRAVVFGAAAGWVVLGAVFLLDLFVGRRAWCGHLCPVGAFYGLIGQAALLRVNAGNRAACTDCMDCYAVCPESHVITPALRGAPQGRSPVIRSGDCSNCGRCIDVCPVDVFAFGTRFHTAPRSGTPTFAEGPNGSGNPKEPRASAQIEELAS
ncbi:MAG: quinol dehydrogenase ferredoxin subunit NapH [Alphaproteobacteria bacterium]|nr:quinol dehydrogenase ferredoxin subunit NapH [Alphaproteobacteria bacterium]